jgi:hypothetical protein
MRGVGNDESSSDDEYDDEEEDDDEDGAAAKNSDDDEEGVIPKMLVGGHAHGEIAETDATKRIAVVDQAGLALTPGGCCQIALHGLYKL